MADLAGNAMTSTVVGTCIMAALVLAGEGGNIPLKKSLKKKDDSNEDEDEDNENEGKYFFKSHLILVNNLRGWPFFRRL